MKNIAIYGAGGLGREVACLLNRINSLTKPTWHLTGFFDDARQPGTSNEYGPILGNINTLNAHPSPPAIIIAIGSPAIVAKIHSQITNPLIDYPNIIDPDAILLDPQHTQIGIGNIIASRCIISTGVKIGNFNLLNTGVTAEHDVNIGNYNTILGGSHISGAAQIASHTFIGANATILPGKQMDHGSSLYAGSVLVNHALPNTAYMGNPAKRILF